MSFDLRVLWSSLSNELRTCNHFGGVVVEKITIGRKVRRRVPGSTRFYLPRIISPALVLAELVQGRAERLGAKLSGLLASSNASSTSTLSRL